MMKLPEARKITTRKDYREQLLQLTWDQPSFGQKNWNPCIYTTSVGMVGVEEGWSRSLR